MNPSQSCSVCEGRDLGTTDGPNGEELPVVCGACTDTPLDDAIHVVTPDGFDTLCGPPVNEVLNAVPLRDALAHGVDAGAGCWTCIEKMEKHR